MKRRKATRLALETGSVAIAICILVLSCSAVYFSREELRSIAAIKVAHEERAPLYLPQAQYVELVTLGYNSFASKLLWFNTINYFGKQFASGQDYRWLGEMCELVTRLDPKATHTFEFCGTLLSWVAKKPDLSTKLLTLGIEANPDYWRFRYLRGFNYWYFLNRLDLAKEDFLTASKIPNAPTFLKTIAAQMIAKENGPTLARQFLEEFVSHTKDPAAKKALEKKLLRAQLSERLNILQNAVDHFKKDKGELPASLDQLVPSGYLRAMPNEPYGKSFILENGEVKSTSNQTGIRFVGKTMENSPNFQGDKQGEAK